ncbi:UDP-N-acetylglucosamine 2-epimerase [Leptospira brenneri]|uniref:UDP-N-acetylglucosamine 2-epimerase (Hydrolyzing) n=1 Tax=Leptospira brenneri TaxID=2023182 RepID=A0A2M9Y1T5_9LEPT|nr:UDP-N-acetylglucosamine 2-epimerase [Leptospira brenneri]PJZ45525.1 UDP-N-acetylglucosamine 2-epimerase (hydrolyzing) [Leptospira brenneri]TGK92018.1 UDP-N-acetylglucosamine 2-epimerase (hydrolyzing) [Leptospira brenneri]
MLKQKICFVTGTRAEYGLLKRLMKLIQTSPIFELQVIATGMHLSPEFGLTYQEIEEDGFLIDRKVEMLLSSDTSFSIAKSVGLGMIGLSDALKDLKPDLVFLLGDRFELLSVAPICLFSNIPIAHIHGGEITEGAYDDAIRHSITKMSNLHFVATEEYRNRVIQLGENPETVFCVGGLGVDAIKNLQFLNKEELENELDFRFGERNLLVTFHPVTLEEHSSLEQFDYLLSALDKFPEINIIFTLPNSDNGSRGLIDKINTYVSGRKNSKAFTSLGQLKYFSTIRFVDAVVGNSSSGLLEVPTLKKFTINIGDRQKGRVRAKSVLDCQPNQDEIENTLKLIYTNEYKSLLRDIQNPYGEGDASEKIFKIVQSRIGNLSTKKNFFDLSQ